ADATDVESFTRTLGAAIAQARETSRPVLIEAHTLRLRGHAAYDTCAYLKPGESDSFFAQDPLPRLRAKLVEAGLDTQIEGIESELNAFLEACVKTALPVPRPDPAGMADELFAPASAPLPWKAEPAEPQQLNFAQALNLAHRKILS